jgi:hypothetical protein
MPKLAPQPLIYHVPIRGRRGMALCDLCYCRHQFRRPHLILERVGLDSLTVLLLCPLNSLFSSRDSFGALCRGEDLGWRPRSLLCICWRGIWTGR